MNTRRISVAVGAAAGGMLAAAFLPMAAAHADDSPSDSGADLFGFTLPSDVNWDGEAGWPPFLQEASTSTTLDFDSNHAADGIFGDLGFGDDGVSGSVGADLANYSVFGIDSQTIELTGNVVDGDGHTVLSDGSVFNVTDFGLGFGNVYSDLAGADDGDNAVTDTLVTPFGNIDLTSLFGDVDASGSLGGDASDALTGIDPSDGLDFGTDLFGGIF